MKLGAVGSLPHRSRPIEARHVAHVVPTATTSALKLFEDTCRGMEARCLDMFWEVKRTLNYTMGIRKT